MPKIRDIETLNPLLFYLLCKYRFKYMSKEGIRGYHFRKTKSILSYAMENTEFYKRKYEGKNLWDIWNLPTTNKKELMDNFDKSNTVGLTKEEVLNFALETEKTRDYTRRLNGIMIGILSGTSGNKGIGLTTQQEEDYLKALFFARFPLPKKQKMNLAFISPGLIPLFNIDENGHKTTHVNQLNPLEQIKKELESIQPNMISGLPSMLQILAKEYQAESLKISPIMLISQGEVLTPEVKGELMDTFKCEVHQIYQCVEGTIAVTCKYGNLHINEDLIAVELFDNQGNPTPDGEPCQKMIITDLHKTSIPIIRYELNDIITISKEPCKCGSKFRVIKQIQGRAEDMFWAKREGNKQQYIFPEPIRKAIVTSSEDIEEYQAIQESPQRILVRIRISKDGDKKKISAAIKKNLQNVFESYKCKKPIVTIKHEDPKPNPNSGKLIRIHRDFEVKT